MGEGERSDSSAGEDDMPRALQESEKRFRALVMASNEVLYRMNADWSEMVQLTSRGFLANTDEPSRCWLDKYIHPADQLHVRKVIDEPIRTKSVFQLEHRVRRADGSWGWTLSRAVPIMDGAGEIIEWFGAASDITATRRQTEDLVRADQEKTAFLATLSHELRNPLAAIQSSADVLVGSLNADGAAAYQVLQRQVGHLTRLVDDLLEVSRITRNRIELRRERLSFLEVLEQALAMTQPRIAQNRQQLIVTVPPEPVTLLADRVRLAQIIVNLLDNASKYTDAGGLITLTARVDPSKSRLTVVIRDTGMGIPPDVLPHIFDLFVQGPGRPLHAGAGMGIGLTVVRYMVELHGGSVSAQSDGPGCGSEFRVVLPVMAPDAQPGETRPIAGAEATLPECRVLVVDDNRDLADILGLLLEQMGVLVKVAYNGTDGLKAVGAFRPTHILLDLGMEPMDGYAVAREVRRNPEFDAVTLVALTGWGTEDDIGRSRAAGFQHHLVKPVNRAALVALLR